MKVTAAEALRFLTRPQPGLLIFGADPVRVAIRRQDVIAALIGPQGEAEMRLTRLAAADLRRDPAALEDGLRAQGFFPGPRVLLVEEATDATAPLLARALADWRPGDAALVVTAGGLTGKSALKTLFERHPAAGCLALYDDPPGRDEIEAELARAGLTRIAPAAMADLTALAQALDPGDFRQTLEKIALYKHADPAPLTPEEVEALAPASLGAEVDQVIEAAADGRADRVGPLMRRLEAQGTAATTICIFALRHVRMLHVLASDPGGPAQGVARLRPPPFGRRRDMLIRQAGSLGRARAEEALGLLVETDLSLRSSLRAPAMAVVERALIRLAMLARR